MGEDSELKPLWFDDDGTGIAVAQPAFYEGDGIDWVRREVRADVIEVMRAVLEYIVEPRRCKLAGQRAKVLAHRLGVSRCKTDAELAKELNISRSRLSQIRSEIRARWPSFEGPERP